MKLSQELNSSLNQQVMHEFRNMLVYRKIQNYFENLQLKKLASYFQKQSLQEAEHADKFVQYINDRTGGLVDIGDIASLPYEVRNLEDVGKIFILVEEETTKSIESIYNLALSSNSFIDLGFIQSMLIEQVEEEDIANEFAMKLNMVKDIVLFDATME